MARLVMKEGFTRVRPLAGGFDAWLAAGYELEEGALLAVRPAGLDRD